MTNATGDEQVPVTVQILDREYQVACPPGERQALVEAARYLDERMREVRDSGKVFGLERISVMTALNMAHEVLELRARETDTAGQVHGRIKQLRAKLDSALDGSLE